MGQDHQGHMVVPAPPEAALVVVQTQLVLPFGKAALNRPAHATGPNQGQERQVGRGVGEVELVHGFLPWCWDGAADQQPDGGAGQPVAHREHPHGGKVGQQGTLGALQDAVAPPSPPSGLRPRRPPAPATTGSGDGAVPASVPAPCRGCGAAPRPSALPVPSARPARSAARRGCCGRLRPDTSVHRQPRGPGRRGHGRTIHRRSASGPATARWPLSPPPSPPPGPAW
jgi:hypothetical protein